MGEVLFERTKEKELLSSPFSEFLSGMGEEEEEDHHHHHDDHLGMREALFSILWFQT